MNEYIYIYICLYCSYSINDHTVSHIKLVTSYEPQELCRGLGNQIPQSFQSYNTTFMGVYEYLTLVQ